jgi:acylphosphatase
MKIRHYRIVVKGRVQGVGFRYNAQAVAHKFNLTGYVRNQHDRSVLLHAEGKEEDLERFIDWCNTGPRLAEVGELIAEELKPEGFKTFEVRK